MNQLYQAAREPNIYDAYAMLSGLLGTKEWPTGAAALLPTSIEWKRASITRRCDILASWLTAECFAVAAKAEMPVDFVNLGGGND